MRVGERGRAALLAATIAVAAALLLAAAQEFRPRAPEVPNGIRVSMTIEGPGWTIEYENNRTTNNTVFGFLLEAARTLHFPVAWSNWSPPYSAVFVDAIGGAVNGQDGRWWVFWVNGEYGTMAADLTIVRDGDVVSWRFALPEGG